MSGVYECCALPCAEFNDPKYRRIPEVMKVHVLEHVYLADHVWMLRKERKAAQS